MAQPGFGYGADLFNDLWAATRTYYSKKMIDMLPRAHPLLDKMAGKGNISAKEGGVGKRNVELILARSNENVRWIKFDEAITSTKPSLLEQIEWDWKFCYQDFVLNDKVLSINSSEEIANLLEINQRALRQGFAISMAKQLYATGENDKTLTDGTEMGGLQYLLSENPYKAGLTVLNLQRGGTPGDKYEFWRNRCGEWVTNTEVTSPSPIWPEDKEARATALVDAMRAMVQVIENGSDSVDGIYCNYDLYNLYVYYMQTKLHINNVPSEKKDAGFTNVEFMGIPIYLDKFCPPNKMFFLNSNYLHFKYLEGENFKQEIRQVPNYFAKQYITTFIGNFIIEKPRCQGVLTINADTNGLPGDCNICNFAAGKYIDYDYVTPASGQSSDWSVERKDYSGSGVYRGPAAPGKSEAKGSASNGSASNGSASNGKNGTKK
jgi:hypothetical protein